MEKTYTPKELAAIAKQAAHEVGAQAICWWQNESAPYELYIEATTQPKNIPLMLVTILPGGATPDTPTP
jgi:hypothetical protein